MTPRRVLVATSNAGKLRDFVGAAEPYGITVAAIPDFSSLPPVVEDGDTFEANARKKAEAYSLAIPGELVIADDSGLEIDALGGAPGVRSARYAVDEPRGSVGSDSTARPILEREGRGSGTGAQKSDPRAAGLNADDAANNARVLRELAGVPSEKRTARFVCVLAAAQDGRNLQVFRGTAEGVILDSPRGYNGFGYDPLFYSPQIGRTFAELSAIEKAQYSHRGAAFRVFLEWYAQSAKGND